MARKATSASGMFGRYATTRSPGPTPSRWSPARARRHLLAQLAEGQLERAARLRARKHRNRVDVLVSAHGVRRVVQLRAREPLRSGHGVGCQHPLVRCVRPDLEEVPERAPEALEIRDRPAVEVVVVAEREPALRLEPVEVAADLAVAAGVRGRRPEHLPLLEGLRVPRHDRRPRARWSRPVGSRLVTISVTTTKEPGRASCSQRGHGSGSPVRCPRPPLAFASLRRTTCVRPRRTGTG